MLSKIRLNAKYYNLLSKNKDTKVNSFYLASTNLLENKIEQFQTCFYRTEKKLATGTDISIHPLEKKKKALALIILHFTSIFSAKLKAL